MKISKRHQVFSNILSAPRVLNHPEEFLGPNWKDVLNFWLYFDTLSSEQIGIARDLFWDLSRADRVSIVNLAWNAARYVTNEHIPQCAYLSNQGHIEGITALELIGSHRILGQGKSLVVVSLLLNS
jgi:hypothetical protein